jgi:hypothetical protein
MTRFNISKAIPFPKLDVIGLKRIVPDLEGKSTQWNLGSDYRGYTKVSGWSCFVRGRIRFVWGEGS